MTNYNFGDIVLVSFPFSGSGKRKQRKQRFALVILYVKDDDIVLAPITSKERIGFILLPAPCRQ